MHCWMHVNRKYRLLQKANAAPIEGLVGRNWCKFERKSASCYANKLWGS